MLIKILPPDHPRCRLSQTIDRPIHRHDNEGGFPFGDGDSGGEETGAAAVAADRLDEETRLEDDGALALDVDKAVEDHLEPYAGAFLDIPGVAVDMGGSKTLLKVGDQMPGDPFLRCRRPHRRIAVGQFPRRTLDGNFIPDKVRWNDHLIDPNLTDRALGSRDRRLGLGEDVLLCRAAAAGQ